MCLKVKLFSSVRFRMRNYYQLNLTSWLLWLCKILSLHKHKFHHRKPPNTITLKKFITESATKATFNLRLNTKTTNTNNSSIWYLSNLTGTRRTVTAVSILDFTVFGFVSISVLWVKVLASGIATLTTIDER